MSQEPPLKRHCCSLILASDHLLSPATKSSHFGWSLMGGLTVLSGCHQRQGPGISLGYYESGPRLLSQESRRKIQPKEIPSCLIPHLFVVFTRQLEILVTSLVLRIEDFCLTILLYPALLSGSIPIETVSRPSSSALHMSRN